MKQPTKQTLATNLYRAWYLATFAPVESLFMPFIENTLIAHYGEQEFVEMTKKGIEMLERNGSSVPDRMREVIARAV